MAGESPASNSSESSPVQRQLNGSVDSGIAVLEVLEMETPTLRRRQRLQQCQRILQVLQRDHSTHRLLRDRLSKIADRKWKKEEAREQQSCNVCCADLDQSSPKTYVTCCTCGKYVCRGPKCADWRPKDADWECQLCHSSKESLAHTSSWVAEQMSFNQHKFVYPMRARSEVYIPITGDGDGDANDSTMHIESISQIGQSAHLEERAKIRAYVEEIVAEMLGGSLDHIKVGQLSKSENYLQFFHKFHAKLSNLLINVESDLLKGDLPAIVNGSNSNSNNNNNNNGDSESLADISQTRLRSLIETIIAETLRNSALSVSGAVSEISLDTRSLAAELPNNGNGLKRRHRTEHYFEPKIYQDLLATAVLNKIADKEGNTRLISESTPDLSGHLIDENYNAEALSTTSGSSIEPRSDCSLTDHELALDTGKSKSLQADLERESVLSDYIAAHMVPLPDFSASVTESEDDVGSISSSMIGDGTWEDNWLFKKKRSSVQSSVTPSSIGMLVPAPMENVRAQIGDRTADEVSDLSELGSDVEDNSLDLLRCNDLNDRLLSKHLIGGQNTKLVLDELVDRTSLISHTLPEEHEPAFTETTNTFVVASSAAPSDIIVSLPSPMVFQDDSMNEELVQTPIAAQGETDELASLEGCIGYSTVEYIDEEQMRETTPSVIEILAAIALGPMLAVPASEQPGVITPSEMHTLKELSDLALAEINARTMDLAHHSLDIIEEENIELMPFTGSVSQPSTINVHPSTLTDPTTNHQSTETTAAQEPKVVPKPAIDSDAPIHNPSTTKILTVDKPAALDPPAAVEISPETDTVAVDPPSPAAAEIIPDAETVAAYPPAPVEIIPETETVAVDPAPPAAVEITPAAETVAVDPPAAALEIIPDAETVAVDPPAPVEIIPGTEMVAVYPAPPAAVEITPAAETVAVDPPAVVEIITEPETVVADPPAAALEITLAAETVAVDPPAAALEIIPDAETVAVDPSVPVEIIPGTEMVAVDPAPPAAVEITPAAETVAVDPPAVVEIITEPETVVADPPAAALEITPAAETVVVYPPAAALEIIPDAETVAVDPPAPVEIIPETETVAVDPVPPAAVEITPAAETVAVDPPAAALEIIPDAATVAVDPPAPVEIIPETETVAVDPASSAAVEITPAAETVAVDPPAVVEIITEPETVVADPPAAALEITLAAETVAVDPPAAALEIIPDAATVAVDPPAPVEIIPETETVAVDPAPPAAVEITPAAETVAVDSPVAVEIISETEIVAVDLPAAGEISPKTDTVAVDRPPPAATEIISEAETVAVDPSVPVEIFPGTEMVAVDPAPPAAVEITPAAETVAVNPPAAVEDVETVSVDPPEAVEIITVTENVAVDPPAALEITPAAETVAVDPPAVVEIIPETETVAVDPAPPAAVEITPAAETVAVDPPAAALEIIPNAETVAVDPPAPVEIIPETETVAVDPAPPAAVEITPAAETVAVDPPAAALEIIPNAETVAVDPPAPVEIIPETETVAVDPALPAAVEITPAAETVAVDPPAVVEIITEPETVVADPPAAALEIIPDAATVAVDPPAPVEIIPETEMVAVDHAPPAALEITPAAETVAVDPSAAAEIIPETETVAVDPSPPAVVEIIAGTESVVLDPTGAVEFIPETQTKAVEIPAVEVEAKSVSDLGPNALIDDTQLLSCVPKPLKESDNMDTSLLEPSSECVPAQTSVEYTKSDSSALGSIAEREVKKWYNAVEMPNNPYAPEALKQRISGTQERYMDVPNISPSAEQKALAAALTEDGDPAPPSTDYKRYSRDYYINNAPNGTEVNGIVRRASSGAEKQPSAEDVEQDIVITEAAQNASTTAIEQDKEQESVAANVYTALPAQVFDDLLETQSNPSLHSLQTTTTTSDESETVRVYDFNKQETTVIRPAPAEQQPSSSTTSSMESAQSASVSSSSIDASVSKKRERPVVLQFGPADSVPTIGSPVNTPTRGSTPPAFRFLQPKRRLIEPSQVLSVDEDDVMEPNTPVAEKPAVEDEVVHAMPSVKALAQAFLLTSKAQQAERRWRSKVRLSLPADTSDKSPTSLARRHKLEHAVSMAEVADESTIASDLSSLETDPSIQSDGSTNPPIASPVTPVPVRHGFLRSNIAFFENLKFK
ncbi:serine-rich adhesin for platelets isoform X14 [Drosophila pseudoobscura]|uniref:Serine-rich adhesin for platelets isoform X14 n=1 Tax=Drosophila pseudoobscura pseudoobscura TaxID=46245 RepID=A0A6I8VSX2_DROPS|nr:serine-rich adhesin for platelets isoform X14 [Drosophila pseudoobscura]